MASGTTRSDLRTKLNLGQLFCDGPYFFRRTFRHAFAEAFPDNFAPGRKDEDEVVTELIARLDRHKGDSAFVDLWKKEFRDSRDDVVAQVRIVLQSDQGSIPEEDA
jgi:hypothetical protein